MKYIFMLNSDNCWYEDFLKHEAIFIRITVRERSIFICDTEVPIFQIWCRESVKLSLSLDTVNICCLHIVMQKKATPYPAEKLNDDNSDKQVENGHTDYTEERTYKINIQEDSRRFYCQE